MDKNNKDDDVRVLQWRNELDRSWADDTWNQYTDSHNVEGGGFDTYYQTRGTERTGSDGLTLTAKSGETGKFVFVEGVTGNNGKIDYSRLHFKNTRFNDDSGIRITASLKDGTSEVMYCRNADCATSGFMYSYYRSWTDTYRITEYSHDFGSEVVRIKTEVYVSENSNVRPTRTTVELETGYENTYQNIGSTTLDRFTKYNPSADYSGDGDGRVRNFDWNDYNKNGEDAFSLYCYNGFWSYRGCHSTDHDGIRAISTGTFNPPSGTDRVKIETASAQSYGDESVTPFISTDRDGNNKVYSTWDEPPQSRSYGDYEAEINYDTYRTGIDPSSSYYYGVQYDMDDYTRDDFDFRFGAPVITFQEKTEKLGQYEERNGDFYLKNRDANVTTTWTDRTYEERDIYEWYKVEYRWTYTEYEWKYTEYKWEYIDANPQYYTFSASGIDKECTVTYVLYSGLDGTSPTTDCEESTGTYNGGAA